MFRGLCIYSLNCVDARSTAAAASREFPLRYCTLLVLFKHEWIRTSRWRFVHRTRGWDGFQSRAATAGVGSGVLSAPPVPSLLSTAKQVPQTEATSGPCASDIPKKMFPEFATWNAADLVSSALVPSRARAGWRVKRCFGPQLVRDAGIWLDGSKYRNSVSLDVSPHQASGVLTFLANVCMHMYVHFIRIRARMPMSALSIDRRLLCNWLHVELVMDDCTLLSSGARGNRRPCAASCPSSRSFLRSTDACQAVRV